MGKKVLSISAKCSDLCCTQYVDENDNVIVESDSYVPQNLNLGGGDYVDLDIDIETGQILNWKKLTAKKVIEEIKKA